MIDYRNCQEMSASITGMVKKAGLMLRDPASWLRRSKPISDMESVPVTHMWCSIVPTRAHLCGPETTSRRQVDDIGSDEDKRGSRWALLKLISPRLFIAPALHYEVRTLRVPLAAALRNSSEDAAR